MRAPPPPKLSKAEADALKWLREHNGDGLFDGNGVVLAAGETAPHTRSTWNALARVGLVEFYGKRPDGTGRGRIRLCSEARP
ncbi:conserved hypothetical protein [Hyphomicrobiales bacterium]|nr:conserved hypothetical protein [Hyphomicrobiales bacterium]CAH1677210.1 conserved hypothetical protein [Hyphomicrobiales bacterium]